MPAGEPKGTSAITTPQYSAPDVQECRCAMDYRDVNWKRAEVWTLGVILLELVSPIWCTLMHTVKIDPKTGTFLPKSLQTVCETWVSAACRSCRVQGALNSVQTA